MLNLLAAINWSTIGTVALILVFLLTCVLLILVVLIQKPQGGGLAGAFGSGAGSGQTAFGAKTGDALTVATIILFVVWLMAAVALNYAIRPASMTLLPTAAPTTGGDPATPAAPAQAPAPGATPVTQTPTSTAPGAAPAPVTTPTVTPPPATTPAATTPPATTPPAEPGTPATPPKP